MCYAHSNPSRYHLVKNYWLGFTQHLHNLPWLSTQVTRDCIRDGKNNITNFVYRRCSKHYVGYATYGKHGVGSIYRLPPTARGVAVEQCLQFLAERDPGYALPGFPPATDTNG